MSPIEAYARQVVDGAPAGKYHRLACARHLRDLARQETAEFPYRFDAARADRFVRFAEKLKHYKGEWAGHLVQLQPHQRFRKGCKYGWVHADTGLRRFRNAYEEIPRKNGKTLELAIEQLYLAFFDGEPGAEAYCAATKRDQALIIFGDCQRLVKSSGLRTRLTVLTSNIHDERTASKLEPLSADYNSMDGLNIHAACIDEMHAFKGRGIVDVIETGTGARRQPLVNKITTAGDDPISTCGEEHDYACKILEDVLTDDTYFAFIAHADEADDWTAPATAAKANPNYGVSVNPEDLAAKVRKAQGIPAAAAMYKQKHLNLWVNASAPCLSLDGWRRGQSDWDPDELVHERCYVGIDLSTKIDLCAVSFVFPPAAGRPRWRLLQAIWTPADTVIDRAHLDRAPYPRWIEQGWLQTSPGSAVDHTVVRDLLNRERQRFDLEQIGFDPWHAGTLIHDLVKRDGFAETQVLEVPQTFAGLAEAEATFKALVLAGEMDARGCPVTAWAVSNVVEQVDGKGNIQFTKKKSRGRIDPVKSATIGLSLALRHAQPADAVLAEWV